MPKKISIIVPVYNEEKNVPLVYNELTKLFKTLPDYELELVFVNDGSADGSQENILKLANADSRVKFLEFSRNFGKELATSAGLNASTGDAAMMIDADLQHPIHLIPQFIEKWEEGNDVVIGVRRERKGEGFIKVWGSKIFNLLIERLSDTEMMHNATDFRLMDRMVVNEFKKFSEKNRITRGLVDWLGFKKEVVYFDTDARKFGEARYGFFKLLRLALNTFVTHSLFPLKLAGYLGIIIMSLSGPLGLFIFLEKYVFHDPWDLNFTGSATLAVILLFLVGIILSCLGLIALYIGNIHMEVNNRPMYVIRRKKLGT
jgi:polyisoprenyl-phosphate glycosyltransferase